METNTPNVPAQAPTPVSPAPASAPQGKPGLTEGVWSIVLAVIALGFLPPVFGAIGIYLGYKSKKKGQVTLGTVGIALSVVCMVIGMFVGALVSVWLANRK